MSARDVRSLRDDLDHLQRRLARLHAASVLLGQLGTQDDHRAPADLVPVLDDLDRDLELASAAVERLRARAAHGEPHSEVDRGEHE